MAKLLQLLQSTHCLPGSGQTYFPGSRLPARAQMKGTGNLQSRCLDHSLHIWVSLLLHTVHAHSLFSPSQIPAADTAAGHTQQVSTCSSILWH